MLRLLSGEDERAGLMVCELTPQIARRRRMSRSGVLLGSFVEQ